MNMQLYAAAVAFDLGKVIEIMKNNNLTVSTKPTKRSTHGFASLLHAAVITESTATNGKRWIRYTELVIYLLYVYHLYLCQLL